MSRLNVTGSDICLFDGSEYQFTDCHFCRATTSSEAFGCRPLHMTSLLVESGRSLRSRLVRAHQPVRGIYASAAESHVQTAKSYGCCNRISFRLCFIINPRTVRGVGLSAAHVGHTSVHPETWHFEADGHDAGARGTRSQRYSLHSL
jgi:hypothetical protein